MENCIFCKIANKEIAKDFTYEDEDVMVFPDIHPVAPVHLLIVPKKHIRDFEDFRDDNLLGKIRAVAQKMIKEQKINDKGYRLVINGGGAQVIDHLHIHLMGKIDKKVKL